MAHVEIHVNKTYDDWTVISLTPPPYKSSRYVMCRCVCGVERAVSKSALNRGLTKSCGCGKSARISARLLKHGHSPRRYKNSTVYGRWSAMKSRCSNPSDKNFANYGGRGIKVDPRWSSFENFLADMGEPPPGTILDRKEVNGNYEKDNCRWATSRESTLNRRDTLYATRNGVRKPVLEWCQDLNLPYGRVVQRISKGLSAEDALSQEPIPPRKWREAVSETCAQIAEQLGAPLVASAIRERFDSKRRLR